MDTVILKHILSAQGSVDRAELECNLGDASLIAQIVDATDQLVACWSSGAARVVARSRARLCRAQECPGCGGLHLCKNLLLSGACHSLQSRRGCSFSHDLRSEYNVEVLMKFGLESLSRTELRLLLLQSDNTLLPQICHDYNNPCGCWVECPRLHVCERHLSGGGPCCCTRAHDFTATQPLRLLREKNIPTDLFKVLKSVYANREALRLADKAKGDDDGDSSDTDRDAIGDAAPDCAGACDSDSSSTVSATQNQSGRRGGQKKTRGGKGRTRNKQADAGVELDEPECQAPMTDVICMFFIRGHCQHEDRCLNVHDDLPYRWQVKHGGFWVSMAENERIEEDFCDPQKTSSATCPSVCFETMRSGQSRVRRLSTLNSVVKPNYSHTTDWLWHWEDDSGQWHQYAQSKHRLIRVTSKQLEETYVKKEDARTFTAGSQLHRLSFRDMIERNLTDGGERRVRRRPRFVSAADVRTKRNRSSNFTVSPFFLDKTQLAQKGPNAFLAPETKSNMGQLVPTTFGIFFDTKPDPFSMLLSSGSQVTATATTVNALSKRSTAPEANSATPPQLTSAATSKRLKRKTTKVVNTISPTTPRVTSPQQAANAQLTSPVTSASGTATCSVNTFSATAISQMTPPTTKSQFTFTTQTTSADFKLTTPAAATILTSKFTSAPTTGTTLTNECSITPSTCGLKSPEQVLTNASQSKLTSPTSSTLAAPSRTTVSVTTASSNPLSPALSVDRSQMTPTTSAAVQSQFTSSTLKSSHSSSTSSPSAFSKPSTATTTTKSQLAHAATATPTSNFTPSTLTASGPRATNPLSTDSTPSKSQMTFSTASNSPNAFSTSSTKNPPATTYSATSLNPFSTTLSADRLQKMTPDTVQSQFTSPALKTSELKPSNPFLTDLATLKFDATPQFTVNSPNAFSTSSSAKPELKSTAASASPTRSLTTTAATKPQTVVHFTNATSSGRSHTSSAPRPGADVPTHAATSSMRAATSSSMRAATSSMRGATSSTRAATSSTSAATSSALAATSSTSAATSSTLAGKSPKAFPPPAADPTFARSASPVTGSATSATIPRATATKSKDCNIS